MSQEGFDQVDPQRRLRFGAVAGEKGFRGGAVVDPVDLPGLFADFSVPDRGGQQGPDRLFLAAAVVVGHPEAEFDQVFRNAGAPGGKSRDLLQNSAGIVAFFHDRKHEPGPSGTAERHVDHDADPDRSGQFVRDLIVERPVEGQIDDDFRYRHVVLFSV